MAKTSDTSPHARIAYPGADADPAQVAAQLLGDVGLATGREPDQRDDVGRVAAAKVARQGSGVAPAALIM